MSYEYIERFNKMGFGIFVHFGLYSVIGRGEWYHFHNKNANWAEYVSTIDKFDVRETWARDLVKLAKKAGAKYITLTTRHHDGFSLYDTMGLNNFDAPHSLAGRDLVREFVDACHEEGIVPFFYHTLLDWSVDSYENNFPKYIDYLVKSIEILCANYGKVGGFWFDGMWDKPDADWQENRLYGTIRRLQPEAMIINNTGISATGQTGHLEIDSVTFERGAPRVLRTDGKPVAGEMCQVLNDHWGYCQEDINYKPMRTFIENLTDCRSVGCNYLLNVGPRGDGSIPPMDEGILLALGKWIEVNKGFVYNARPTDLYSEGCEIVEDEEHYYVIVKDVDMAGDPNVTLGVKARAVRVDTRISGEAKWLDNGDATEIRDGVLVAKPFDYECNYCVRVAVVDK